MPSRVRFFLSGIPLLVLGACAALALAADDPPPVLHAGAAVIDIAPPRGPVRVNGMFTERMAEKIVDPLTARALALDDGTTRLVFCVVDTCMMPRDLIDSAKKTASEATGVGADRMLVSATHTHSAPSAMGCLGSRVDPAYAALLPGKIAEAITAAVRNLHPARAGWTAFDDWNHTFNRRWIRRPDRLLTDPFGERNVRANMHPGHQSPDVTGPSGPVDPQVTLLAVETADGKPLALLANYSMHYQGSPLLSSDYFGRLAVHLGRMLGADEKFTGMMSQGTSGDLWSGDCSQPAGAALAYDEYAKQIAVRVAGAYQKIEWKSHVPLAMEESTLALDYRLPDDTRLTWARQMQEKLGDRLPQSKPEIYALEAVMLHERRKTELKLQAVSIGGLGITALPNEVFCLTGLKLKARSPFALTMNIGLANGAEGYIPPPEQHALGGYTTWPARTAGLEMAAEPKITAAVTALLEKVSGKPARKEAPVPSDYAKAVMSAGPQAYWRLEEMDAGNARDETGHHPAVVESGVAVHLPGVGEKPRNPPPGRAYHFAGGRLKAQVPLGDTYSVAFWLWNGLPAEARAVTGYAFSRGTDGDKRAAGEHLGIGGTWSPGAAGRLLLFNGNAADQFLVGKSPLALKAWHHVVLVREGVKVRVHLDGRPVPDLEGELPPTVPAGESGVFIGGRCDNLFNWEGKLDEVAVFNRALSGSEASQLYQASKQVPPTTALAPEFPARSPEQGLKSIHVPAGFKVELAASEPAVMDPIAIDWDLAGRLWVVEMADYPSGMDNKGKAGGRVRVLEDTNGDGRYEKSTLFAENLNFPTGLLTWRDGVIVTAAPEVLFLTDANHDGKADRTQNSRALWQDVLPDHYLKRNPHVPAPDPTHLIVTPLNAPVYPVSPAEKRFHSFENSGHFTSACSGMIYRDDLLWPRRDRELDAFTCEPFHNLVQHSNLVEAGVTYGFRRALGEDRHDFFASEDRWCRPVMARTGPDGALWVVDMYRYMIEHPAWLPENGRAELLPHYRLGDDKGRIYRVVPVNHAPRQVPRLDGMGLPELIAALDSSNGWQRDKAHMALVWQLRGASADDKIRWIGELQRLRESPNATARLQSLAVMDGIGVANEATIQQGLRDQHPAVRELALRLAERVHNPAIIAAAETLVDDPDAKVRLQLALSIGAWGPALHPAYASAGPAAAPSSPRAAPPATRWTNPVRGWVPI